MRIIRRRSRSPTPSRPKIKKGKSLTRLVNTLDQGELTISDYVDFSGYTSPRVHFRTIGSAVQIHYHTSSDEHVKFPPGTSGYLYFDRQDPPPHVASGALRMRIAKKDTDVQTAFAAGYDLRHPNGWQPWAVPLLALRQQRWWEPAYTLLRADDLITAEEDKQIEKFLELPLVYPERNKMARQFARTMLLTVFEPFPMDFSNNMLSLIVLDPEEIKPIYYKNVLAKGPQENYGCSPYSGVGLVQFEACRTVIGLSGTRKSDDPLLVLRFLQWLVVPRPWVNLSPASASMAIPMQTPGTLVKTCHTNGYGSRQEPWVSDGERQMPLQSWAMLMERDL